MDSSTICWNCLELEVNPQVQTIFLWYDLRLIGYVLSLIREISSIGDILVLRHSHYFCC
jgi:hypothetical protein